MLTFLRYFILALTLIALVGCSGSGSSSGTYSKGENCATCSNNSDCNSGRCGAFSMGDNRCVPADAGNGYTCTVAARIASLEKISFFAGESE